MVLTDAMKAYAKSHLGAGADATDDQIRPLLGAAVTDGRIPPDAWAGLHANKAVDPRGVITDIVRLEMKGLEDRISALVKGGTPAAAATAGQQAAGNGTPAPAPAPAPLAPELERAVGAHVKSLVDGMGLGGGSPGGRLNPTEFLAKTAGADSVRLKGPLERYSQSRGEARWPGDHKHADLRNRRMTYPSEEGPGCGRPLDMASQADKALLGAYFKWCANSSWHGGEMPAKYRLTDHDRDLVAYMVHELPWTGFVGGGDESGTAVDGIKLSAVHHGGATGIKALLDDSVSGGINAAPIVIEDQLIIVPLLYGELFPLVTVVNIARGRRIHQATIGRPVFTSGIPEGTPIPLFDTTNFLGTFDLSVFTAVGAMEIGLDFEEDSPSNVGASVVAAYGEAALAWLDRVIALGDGVSEPLGIFNTAGLTTVASANGPAGPLTVADSESLMFGMRKEYRTSRGMRNVFIGNDVSYRRFRSIPLGSTWANSRAFGADYGNYQVLNMPFKVVNLVPNNWVAFANMAYYRCYRRLGMTVRVETAGRTLALNNSKLVVVRQRYAGAPEQGGAFSLLTDAPS